MSAVSLAPVVEDSPGIDFKLADHSLGCSDRMIAIERLNGLVVTNPDNSQFSKDATQLF